MRGSPLTSWVAGASLNPTEPWSPHLEMGLTGFCENKWLHKVHRTISYLYVLPLLLIILVVILDVLLKTEEVATVWK